VGDGVEEVVIAGVKAIIYHGTSDTKHSSTSVLELDVELGVTLVSIFDLGGEGISSRNPSKIIGRTSISVQGGGVSL
jgi:hypothetical protein